MMIFETHAHYDDERFDEDRNELLESFRDNGIDIVVNVGASLAGCEASLELSKRYDYVYATLGVHPNDTVELTEEKFTWLENAIKENDKVLAVGEIGLDYHYLVPDEKTQQMWFERQIELARKVNKPLMIHSRDAAKDTYDIMSSLHCEELGGDIHCFSYSVEEARKYLNMGFYLGIGGVLTFKNARKLVEVVEYAPLDRLLLETDSPYLAPEPNRGKRNSSLNLIYVAQKIAEIKNISVDEVVEMTAKNARKMYRLDKI